MKIMNLYLVRMYKVLMITNLSVVVILNRLSKQVLSSVFNVLNCLTNGLSRTGTQVSDVRAAVRNRSCEVFEAEIRLLQDDRLLQQEVWV